MTAKIHSNVPLFDPAGDQDSEKHAAKVARIKREFVKAGMTKWGLAKYNTRYLPRILHPNEHVMAVIYGRFSEAPGFLNWVDRMIVATDRRIISLNHKPGYTDIDEFTYDIVDGVEISTVGPFSAVRLNTKIDSLAIRFVNNNCAEKFVHYIEKRRLEFFQTSVYR